ncbi:Hsp20/alpha crystallin family protein [bacterium]|nr:Hsp20/alpha crystallin family protein [bacterium]
MSEEQKHHWLKISAIIIVSFIAAFIAFYLAMQAMMVKITDPLYNAKRIEKIVQHQQKELRKFENSIVSENPFEPKIRPRLVSLVKEPEEYKIIVDLKPLEGNENGIDVNIKDNIITIKGELDKKTTTGEKIINFSQSYYLEEKINSEKITKEKKGDKYIITLPFED